MMASSNSTKSEKNPQTLLNEVSAVTGTTAGPLLGGTSEVEQSPLERLILQSTSEQAASSPFFHPDPAAISGLATRQETDAYLLPRDASSSSSSLLRSSLVTLGAGTLCFLQIGLVWASYLSNDWFETHSTISFISTTSSSSTNLEETSPEMRDLEFSTDQILQKTSLASLLSMLLRAEQDWTAMILVLASLICPCLCMILCPIWTVGDYHGAIALRRASSSSSTSRRQLQTPPALAPNSATVEMLLGFDPRIAIVEHFVVRLSFLLFFLLAILDVGTSSSLGLENNPIEFIVTNRTKGGLLCYTLGMACALGVVVVLRVAAYPCFQPPTPATTSWQGIPPVPCRELQRPLLADETGVLRVDLVAGNSTWGASKRTGGPYSYPALTTGDDNSSGLPYWKRMVVYEFGILALVLWIPALFLPLFQVALDGILASFTTTQVDFEVPFYQLPILLLQRSIAAGTDRWALLSLGVVFLLLVYILPLGATASAVAAWNCPDHSKHAWFYTAILRYIQPCLCGVVFSLSLLLAIPILEPFGNYLSFDTQTTAVAAGFCQRLENITDNYCLVIRGHHRLGLWFLLGQSISLEIFVLLTILWKR